MIRIIKDVYGHCDGPCGHYETDTLRNSALTVQKLMDKLLALGDRKTPASEQEFIRLINLKEEHAQICKQQIYILWSDYFKPADYEKYPDLMFELHQTAGVASSLKQNLSSEAATLMLKKIAVISDIFKEVQQSRV